MNDFTGQALSVGDQVIACVRHGKHGGAFLVDGKVLRLIKKVALVQLSDRRGDAEVRRINPRKLVKFQPNTNSETRGTHAR